MTSIKDATCKLLSSVGIRCREYQQEATESNPYSYYGILGDFEDDTIPCDLDEWGYLLALIAYASLYNIAHLTDAKRSYNAIVRGKRNISRGVSRFSWAALHRILTSEEYYQKIQISLTNKVTVGITLSQGTLEVLWAIPQTVREKLPSELLSELQIPQVPKVSINR